MDWDKVWEEFDKWYMKQINKRCKTCNTLLKEPEWETQKKVIQRIVITRIYKES